MTALATRNSMTCHAAISRLCEMGLTLPEVALISGHKDPRMLFRYVNLRPADLAAKLKGRLGQFF